MRSPAMPETPLSPLDSLRSKFKARTEATDTLREVVGELKRVVAATGAIISSDVEIAGGLASELRAIANSICEEPMTSTGIFGSSAGTAIVEGMRRAVIDMEVPSAFERICEYFWSRDNEPATVGQIIAGTKSSAAAVRQLIYNRRRDQFVKVHGLDSIKYKLAELVPETPKPDAPKETVKPP